MRVHDVMTTHVATARTDAPLKDLAAQLAVRGISGMPVVDDDGNVVGVVSEADVSAKALAKMVRTVPGVVSVRSELTWPEHRRR
jgi:CBS-domain-containing membrane protein